jgi:hypothetical protein
LILREYKIANISFVLDADWGLQGISRPRPFAQRSETVNGVELAVEFPSFRDLNSSKALVWNDRGWTLQEKLLSKRMLLFTDFQMYFRCANSVCTEDIAMETEALSDSISKRRNPFKWGAQSDKPSILDQVGDLVTLHALKLTDKSWDLTFLPNYVSLVEEYSQRTFSHKQDTIKAISGVLRSWATSDLDFPGGLPRDWLSDALLWQPRDGSKYSIDYGLRAGMPTWSWAPWSLNQGCVWSEYTKRIARGEQQMTIHVEERESVHSYCIEEHYKGPWPWVLAKRTPEPLSTTARQQLKISGTLLSFKTPVCVFRIGKATDEKRKSVSYEAIQTFYLLDGMNQRVGKIWTCARVAQMPRDHDFIALSFRRTGIALKDAVAEQYIPQQRVSGGSYTDFETGTYYSSPDEMRPAPTRDWKVINVMLVQRKDDVAFRVAVGQVISTAWESARQRLVYPKQGFVYLG